MENEEIINKKPIDRICQVMIAEAICVILIILMVLAIKFFFADTYSELKDWYQENICDTTDVYEVLGDDYDL